jgi:CRISPR-associated exonuclease Cas4
MDPIAQVPLSALHHLQYCPRQCGLVCPEQVCDDNVHSLLGQAVHANAELFALMIW